MTIEEYNVKRLTAMAMFAKLCHGRCSQSVFWKIMLGIVFISLLLTVPQIVWSTDGIITGALLVVDILFAAIVILVVGVLILIRLHDAGINIPMLSAASCLVVVAGWLCFHFGLIALGIIIYSLFFLSLLALCLKDSKV